MAYKLRAVAAVETIAFDTPDEDLDKQHYAQIPNTTEWVIIRDNPKNNMGPFVVKSDTVNTKDYTEIQIKAGHKKYFAIFILPTKRLYRQEITAKEYAAMGTTFPVNPIIELTDDDIAIIEKDDAQWQ